MIKAVFFDATETLIFLPKGVAHHYREVAQRHGMILDEAALALAFRNAWNAMPPRAASEAARPDDDKGWWRELVANVIEECGGKPTRSAFAAFFEALYAHFAEPGVWALYPEVLPVLNELRDKYRFGVISNFDQRLRAILNHLRIADLFGAIALSSETGVDKPDARIFQRALAELRVHPHEAVHVGDDPVRDWQGAEAAGLHSFHLNRKENSLADLPVFLAAISPSCES